MRYAILVTRMASVPPEQVPRAIREALLADLQPGPPPARP
jgi:hypothetical protein